MNKFLGFLAFCALFFTACDKQLSTEEQLVEDLNIIQQYLSDNNLTAESTDSGLHYFFTQEGTGAQPDILSEVEVRYTGYKTNGDIFDATQNDDTVTFPLTGVIEAWQEGIPLMKKGSKMTMIAPSELCYGRQGSGSSIGPNTVLIFDVELVDF